jgi:multiple sugar transport system substrate-binding protein
MSRAVRHLSVVWLALLLACTPSAQPAQPPGGGPLIFFSTQFKPVEEAEKMRQLILKDAPVVADFIPEDPGPFNDRLIAEQKAGKVTVSLVGGLHGDFAPFVKTDQLEDLCALLGKLGDREFPASYLELARLGTRDKSYYVPWMQATYVLAVNKKALPYLPSGADINALTYAQLKEWSASIQ